MTSYSRKPAGALLLALACAGAAVVASPAHAEGLYLGGNLGTPSYQDPVNGFGGSGSGLSGKLYGGWQFTPNVALEAGLADLGHSESTAGRVDGRASFVDVVGTWPVSPQWSVLGRLGVARVNLDTSAGDDAGSGLKLGLGAEYQLQPNMALRGEWERYRPGVFADRPEVDQYTFGVRVSF